MTSIITVVDLPAAIRAGSPDQGSRKIEIDVSTLTQPQREALLECSVSRNEYEAHNVPSNTPCVHKVVAHTQAEVVRVLDERAAESEKKAAREAEKLAKREASLARIAEWARTAPVEALADGANLSGAYHAQSQAGADLDWDSALPTAAALVGREDEVRAYIRARTEHDRAEKTAREAANQIEREAESARLRAWAERSGSARLRKMLTLDVGDWEDVAEREYMDAAAPEGYTYGCRRGDERRKPTLPDLAELERLRALCAQTAGVLSVPGLLWVIEESEFDGDSGEQPPAHRYCVATVRVTAPNGTSACYDREIES